MAEVGAKYNELKAFTNEMANISQDGICSFKVYPDSKLLGKVKGSKAIKENWARLENDAKKGKEKNFY